MKIANANYFREHEICKELITEISYKLKQSRRPNRYHVF
jgi:hypothetical protein